MQCLLDRQFRCTQSDIPTRYETAAVIHESSAHNQLQSLEKCSYVLVIVPTPLRSFLQEIRDTFLACRGTEKDPSTCLLSSPVILLRYFRARTHILKNPKLVSIDFFSSGRHVSIFSYLSFTDYLLSRQNMDSLDLLILFK